MSRLLPAHSAVFQLPDGAAADALRACAPSSELIRRSFAKASNVTTRHIAEIEQASRKSRQSR
ncbi:MAG TPA: hypothetical protein VJN43_09425 [Bryobacteraceae bacterium]|nr:hypothetical protein [Bryobacteraceae bacterium]